MNPNCPAAAAGVGGGCNCFLPPVMWGTLNIAGSDKAIIDLFDEAIGQQNAIGTLARTWAGFGGAANICQGLIHASEQHIDQEMNAISGVIGTPNVVNLAAANPWNAIRDEIVNHQRMVIVTFVNPANPAEAHSCVAFLADNDAGAKCLWLWNPWGNLIPITGINPINCNIAYGLGMPPMMWNIYQYTTFNY